jgi:hypothetical protein
MGRWRDLLILLLIYLYISYAVAEATDSSAGQLAELDTKQLSTIQSVLKYISRLNYI